MKGPGFVMKPGPFGVTGDKKLAVAGLQGVADFLQQDDLRIFLIDLLGAQTACTTLVHLVDGEHDAEVQCRCNQQEVDDGGDEHTDLDVAEGQPVVEVRCAEDGCDSRHEDVLDEGVHNCGEGAADDQTYGEVDNVATSDKFFESLNHVPKNSGVRLPPVASG